MATSPLSARHSVVAVSVGGRVLYLGGRDTPMCGPTASCLPPSRPALRDAAAYDPVADTWVAIAPAPEPIDSVSHVSSAVLGARLYLLSSEYARAESGGPTKVNTKFLAYDVSADTWSVLPPPPAQDRALLLVPIGTQVAALAGSHEDASGGSIRAAEPLPEDQLFDPTTARWKPLPPDPHRPAWGRQALSLGDRIMLLSRVGLPRFDGQG